MAVSLCASSSDRSWTRIRRPLLSARTTRYLAGACVTRWSKMRLAGVVLILTSVSTITVTQRRPGGTSNPGRFVGESAPTRQAPPSNYKSASLPANDKRSASRQEQWSFKFPNSVAESNNDKATGSRQQQLNYSYPKPVSESSNDKGKASRQPQFSFNFNYPKSVTETSSEKRQPQFNNSAPKASTESAIDKMNALLREQFTYNFAKSSSDSAGDKVKSAPLEKLKHNYPKFSLEVPKFSSESPDGVDGVDDSDVAPRQWQGGPCQGPGCTYSLLDRLLAGIRAILGGRAEISVDLKAGLYNYQEGGAGGAVGSNLGVVLGGSLGLVVGANAAGGGADDGLDEGVDEGGEVDGREDWEGSVGGAYPGYYGNGDYQSFGYG